MSFLREMAEPYNKTISYLKQSNETPHIKVYEDITYNDD